MKPNNIKPRGMKTKDIIDILLKESDKRGIIRKLRELDRFKRNEYKSEREFLMTVSKKPYKE